MKDFPQLKADLDLLRELEILSAGDLVHARLNLVGAYSSAVNQFNQTGDQDFHAIASDAHHALRIMLVRLRLRYMR
ncbi:MAG TPA: hypothetical protein VIM48_00675 [Chthoniobacterales bacterium]